MINKTYNYITDTKREYCNILVRFSFKCKFIVCNFFNQQETLSTL